MDEEARTALIRIWHPCDRRIGRALRQGGALRSDASSDAAHPGLTIRPAQYRSQRAFPTDGEEGAMEWVACVGLDWGEKQHAYEIDDGHGRRTTGVIDSSPEDIHAWVRNLRERFRAARS